MADQVPPTPTPTPPQNTGNPGNGGVGSSPRSWKTKLRSGLQGHSFAEQEQQLSPDNDPRKPEEGDAPKLSLAASELVARADAALVRPRSKKEKRTQEPTLAVVEAIGVAAPEVRHETVTALDADTRLDELLHKTGYRTLWSSEASALATLAILKERTIERCRAEIKELIAKKPNKVMDRWEARLTLELSLLLSDEERAELANQDQLWRAETNASNEYKDSSRYDTYGGNARKGELTLECTEDRRVAPETKDAKGKATSEHTLEDLVAMTDTDLDCALPTTSDDVVVAFLEHDAAWNGVQRLTMVLRFALGRGLEGRIEAAVKSHWASHGELIAPLGFWSDGRWQDPIVLKRDKAETHAQVTTKETVATTEDTDREALLAQAIDPELWAKAPPARFASVLRMVVQADEAASVKTQAAAFWQTRGGVLAGLGFKPDGSWHEVIVDATASDWFNRTLASLKVFGQALRTVCSLGNVKFETRIDLRALTSAFPGVTGVALGAPPTDPHAVLDAIMGPDHAKQFAGLLGHDAPGLLEGIVGSPDGAEWLVQRMIDLGFVTEGADVLLAQVTGAIADDKDRKGKGHARKEGGPEDVNDLVVSGGSAEGVLRFDLPMLAIAGIHRRSGEQMIKSEPSLVSGVSITLQKRTPFKRERSATLEIKKVALAGLVITTPQGMTAIQGVSLTGLTIKLESPETRPATWLEKVGHIAQQIGLAVLQGVSGQSRNIFVKAGLVIGRLAVTVPDTLSQLLGGLFADASQLSIAFTGIDLDGLATSGGDHLDHVGVGETQLEVGDERGLGLHRRGNSYRPTADAKHAKAAKLEAEGHHLRAARKERKADKLDVLANEQDEAASGEYSEDNARLIVAGPIVREHEQAKRQAKRIETRLKSAEASGKEARAGKLKERLEQNNRVIARTDRSMKDHVALYRLDLEIAAAQKEIEEAKDKHDADRLRAAKDKATALEAKRAALETSAVTVSGSVGAIDVAGLDMGGTKVDKVHLDPTEVTKNAGGGMTMTNAHIQVEGLELGSDRRRDVQIPQEIHAIEEGARLARKPLSQDQIKRVSLLKQELDLLEPFVAEYELLRGRIRELEGEEKARFLELRKKLEGPAGTKVAVARLDHVKIDLGATQGANGEVDQGLGVTAGHVHAEGIESNDTAHLARGGDLSVAEVDLHGMDLTQHGLSGLASPSVIQSANLASGQVEHIDYSGAFDEASKRQVAIAAERQNLADTLATLAADSDRRAPITAQIAALDTENAQLESEHLKPRAAFQAFITYLEGVKGTLTLGGVDLTRGATAVGLAQEATTVAAAVAVLTAPDKEGADNGGDTLAGCRARLAMYRSGLADLNLEIAKKEADRPADLKDAAGNPVPKSDTESRHAAALDASLGRRRAVRDEAAAALAAWKKKLSDLEAKHQALTVKHARIVELQRRYEAIVAKARDAGLETIAKEQELTLDGASAFQLEHLARYGVGVGDGYHVDHIGIDALSATNTATTDGVSRAGANGTVSVSGVRQGDRTLIDEATIANLGGGITYDPQARALVLTDFSVGQLALGAIDWEGGGMGVKTASPLAVNDVHISGKVSLDATRPGVLETVRIGSLTSGDLEFRYADYLLGPAPGGSLGLKDVALSKLDLGTYNFNLDGGTLDATRMKADLGRGMAFDIGHLKSGLQIDGGVSTGKYDIALSELEVDDLAIQMQEMGVDVRVEKLSGGSAKLDLDLESGVYKFKDVNLATAKLGPVCYDTPDMKVDMLGGLTLDTVSVAGEMNKDGVTLEKVSAKTAKVPAASVTMGEGKDAQRYSVKSGELSDLALTMTPALMSVAVRKGDLKGLEASLSGTTLKSNAQLESLTYTSFTEGQRSVLELMGLDAQAEVGLGKGKNISANVDDASAKLEMQGETTTFSGVSVKSVALPKVAWHAPDMSIDGTQLAIRDVKADGRMRAYEKSKDGMLLPATDFEITRLHVGQVSGQDLHYVSEGVDVRAGEGAYRGAQALTLDNLNVTGLKSIDGVMKDGKISLDRAVADASGQLGGMKLLSGGLEASGMFLRVQGRRHLLRRELGRHPRCAR